jgi:hypothetical protein
MQIDLYPAPDEIRNPAEDCLDLLRQHGFHPTPSLVEGNILCSLQERPLEDFLTAIQQWTAQQPGRHAQPGESKLQDAERKDPTVTITIHRTPAEKAADATA